MDTSSFQKLLQVRLGELEALAGGSGTDGETVDLDQQRVGRLSRMDALQAQAMAGASEQRRKQEHRRVLAALDRLERGEFGECLECGEPIAIGRLEADPTATLCIECAS